jgi:outer membrane receptor protein involved in Fe transport
MHKRNHWYLLAGLATTAFTVALPAGAAHAADAAAAKPAADEPEIVVTATRRNETLQNVGGEVTALGNADLERIHASTFNDFATQVPGLSFTSYNPTANLIAIRGVASSAAELGSAVSVYLDDMPMGASTQFGLGAQSFNFNLFDMDRVEVLNGPQGTLYGANALGGAIKYVTARPKLGETLVKLELDGSATDKAGVNGALRAAINLPLTPTLALRIDGNFEHDAGWGRDTARGINHLGNADVAGGRAQLLWQPDDKLEVRVLAFGQRSTANGVNVGFYNLATSTAVAGPYDQQFLLDQPATSSVAAVSGSISYDLGFAKAVSVTSWQRNHGLAQTDDSVFYGVIVPIYAGLWTTYFGAPTVGPSPYNLLVDTNTSKVTQEFRLQSASNHHLEWGAGLYYNHETTGELVDLLYSANPNGQLPAPYTNFPFFGWLPSTYKELAGFGDVTGYLGDVFDLTVGVRYSHQNQEYASNISWIGITPAITATGVQLDPVYSYAATSSQGVWTYLINPRVHVSKDVMLYGKVSSGFRPGGPNFVLPFPSSVPPTFLPDKLWNYEIGEKGSFFDHRLTFDIDGYDIEWSDIQTTQNVNGINQLVNAGNARIQGIESNFALKLGGGLSLTGAGAHTVARFTTPALPLGVATSGARLPLSPRWNFTVGALYKFDLAGAKAEASLTDTWTGDRTSGYQGSATNVYYNLPSYNSVNANLGVTLASGVQVSIYARNLLNSKGQVSATTFDNALSPLFPVPVQMTQPLTAGITLRYNWGGR